MKAKLFISVLTFITIGLSAQKTENKIKESEVPEAVKKNFSERYAGSLAKKWELDNGKYEVDFNKAVGGKYTAVFAADGTWLGTGTDVKKKDIPKPILDHVASGEYKTWKFNQARIVETPEVQREIVVEVEKGDDDTMLYYDAEGKFLRAKKE
jgi:hypothetical protein